MIYLLLALSLIGGVAKNVLPKLGGKSCSEIGNLMIVNMITGFFGIALFTVLGICLKNLADTTIILMALGYGICTLGAQSFYMAAVEKGSVSVCSLIYASSFMIPTICSVIFFNETLTLLKALGIVLMIIALVMVSLKKTSGSIGNKTSLILVLISTLFAGGMGILQKVYAIVYGTQSRNEYLFMAFVSILVLSFIIKCVVSKQPEKTVPTANYFWLIATGIAGCTVMVNALNLILVKGLPALVFFPVYNGGTILCSALCSRGIFKEKLSTMQWCGIAVGIIAIVFTIL